MLHIFEQEIMEDDVGNLAAVKAENDRNAERNALSGQGVIFSFPKLITITASERCNYACIMCSQNHDSDRELPLAALRKLDHVFQYANNVCLTGGEPLLYPHFEEITSRCEAGGCDLVIQTNGSLLTEKKRELILEHKVGALKISIDGATQQTYTRIRQGANLHKVLLNLVKLSQRKLDLETPFPMMEINFVAMRSNVHELGQMAVLASELNIPQVNTFFLIARHDYMVDESLYFHQEYADEQLARAYEMGRKVGVHVTFPGLFSVMKKDSISQGCVHNDCRDPWNSLFVNVTGEAGICCGGAGNVGDLTKGDFESVWNSPYAIKLRETVNTPNELPVCKKCVLTKRDPLNVLSHVVKKEWAVDALKRHGMVRELERFMRGQAGQAA